MKRLLAWSVMAVLLVRRLRSPSPLESPQDNPAGGSLVSRGLAWALTRAAAHPWAALLALGTVLVAGALAVSASGLVPIKASAGHWAVTEWFLQFSKTRSIATHAIGIDVPVLDDPALILLGAGHYDLGCRPCHGTGGAMPRIPQAMLPPPPDLASIALRRGSAELFHVVKHGIKLTGMPAWPAQQRDDEVWAVVAFVRRLPRSSAAEYRRLTHGDPDSHPLELVPAEPRAPAVIRETCARCHGIDGLSRGADVIPRLAGQRREYLENALRAFAEGRRHSGIMEPVAAALAAEARQEVISYYSALPLPSSVAGVSADASPRGRMLATAGDPARMIPACLECHGAAGPENPAFPRLNGLGARYIARQLMLMRQGHRGGSEYVHLMHSFVDRLTDQDVTAVAGYFGLQR
jgi:cytochrome c553